MSCCYLCYFYLQEHPVSLRPSHIFSGIFSHLPRSKNKKNNTCNYQRSSFKSNVEKTEAFSINLLCAWNAFVKSLCQPLTFSLFHSLLPAGQLRMRSAGEDPRKQLEWKEQAGEPSVSSRAGLEETIRPLWTMRPL